LIQDKSIVRQLQILETLIDSNEIKSSKDLSQSLKCTSRTIINDISQLKLALPENWDLISVQSKGYLLKRDFSNDFSELIIPYLMNSELYTILIGIFNQKYYSLEKWSQLLYVDKLTLKKFLKGFQEILNQFGLGFNFRPLQLVGPELKIRHFYIMFFYNMQKYKKIFTLNPDLLQKIEYITRIYDVEIDYNLLTIIINVSINRIINKNVIPENLNFKHTFSTYKIKCIESIISELKCYFDINLSENEVIL
ncbi:helix-turn-helix domain-containing protein, partial [Bacillus thuringiensis]|nr:helix-turn-helix domain-containing protein [Bacillus thuringiensis]